MATNYICGKSVSLALLAGLCLLLCPSTAFKAVSFDGCGRIKGCMQSSSSCGPDTCPYAATWRTVKMNNKEYLEVELVGDVKSSNGYISLAFSEDRIIGDDGVIGCYHNSDKSYVQIRAATNLAQGPPTQNRYLKSTDVDKDFLVPDFFANYKQEAEKNKGLDLGGTYSSVTHRIQCRFRRLVKPTMGAKEVKDLTGNSVYYLIVSRSNTYSQDGFTAPFPGGDDISQNALALPTGFPSSLTSSGGNDSPAAKAHGCMMVLAWVLCASVGIIMARYYKDMWPNSKLLGQRIWFQTHRILQSICVILTCLGFIVIFVYSKGYSKLDTWPLYVHPILGIIVFVLTLINPFLALCRCGTGSRNRPIFNWIHFFVGTIAYVLSVPTMMLGFRLSGAGVQLTTLDYPLWILIFFVIFQFCVEIILEIHGCMYHNKNKNNREQYNQDMLDLQVQGSKMNTREKPIEPEPSGRAFKYFMIGLHATVSAIVAIVLVIIIAVN